MLNNATTIKDHKQENKLFIKRLLIIVFFILILTGLLLIRLAYLQIIQKHRYTTLSKQNQLNLIPIEPDRGLIYDRHGNLIASNQPVYSLEIIPDHVKSLDYTIKTLRESVTITEEEEQLFYKEVKQRRRFDPIPLKMQLTDEDVARISVNRYQLSGVRVKTKLMRVYPLYALLTHVLGYVGRINVQELREIENSNYAGTRFIGKAGVEKYYESILHGKAGFEAVEIDANGRVVRILNRIAPISGDNLYLTIDTALQKAAETALEGQRGSVVAINPKNGEILALVSYPSYDANAFTQGITNDKFNALQTDRYKPLYNRAIRGLYPLGSTIKPMYALGALYYDVIDPSYRIRDRGFFQLPGKSHRYRDWKRKGHGFVDLPRAIIVSCDTYFYNLANILGIKRMARTLKNFGFGEKTKVDMSDELSGLVPSPKWKKQVKGAAWYTGDTIAAGIGQGYVLTTPLQLAVATATLANRGQRIQPHLLMKKALPDRTVVTPSIKVAEQLPYSNESWDLVLDAMKNVLSSGEGTAYRYGHDAKYSFAGKTGTAQVYQISQAQKKRIKSADLPEELRDHSLFIGFAPIDDPKIAIAVVVEHASKKAVKIAREVLDFYLLDPEEQSPTGKEKEPEE